LKTEARVASSPFADSTRPVNELLHELNVHQAELETLNDELRKAQAIIEESRDRYVDLYDFAPIGYLTLTHGALIFEVNLTCAETLGAERKELLNRNFSQFVAPEDHGRWQRHLASILQHGGRKSFELALLRGDGSHLHAQLDCRHKGAGSASSVRIALADITERKRAEELLRKSSKEIEDLYNRAPCGYHSLDKDGNIHEINDTELAWLGYARDEVIGKIKWPDLITCESLDAFREDFPRFMEQGFTHDFEVELIRKDGTVLVGLINATAIYDPMGKYLMSRSTVVDITERKQAEQEIAASYKKLQQLSAHLEMVKEEEKGRISRELHDEIGSTLTAIKMAASWLRQNLPDDMPQLRAEADSMSKLIHSTIQNMHQIVGDLRPSLPKKMGFAKAVPYYVQNFMQQSGIACNLVLPETEFNLDCNKSLMLFRIIQESLNNVAKHSQASRVDISLALRDSSIELLIVDNGIGFDQQVYKEQSFGLIGIKERALMMNGKARISSAPDKGTRVAVSIPLTGKQELAGIMENITLACDSQKEYFN